MRVHRSDISSANIPAIFLVIPTTMPARRYQTNEMKLSIQPGSPGPPIVAVKTLIKGRPHPSPSLIANHSQLEGRTRTGLLNAMA
jgi:hypothetical protein